MLSCICVSDTHNQVASLHNHRMFQDKEYDVLLHAGDLTFTGDITSMLRELESIASLPGIKHKIIIPGNHDFIFERNEDAKNQFKKYFPELTILINETVTITDVNGDKFNIYGSPVTPEFYNWAFNVRRGEEIKRYWDRIPSNTDILVTHGPPYGVLDQLPTTYEYVGCHDLWDTIQDRLYNLKLHVFGHIHTGYGERTKNNITFINASICNSNYVPTNDPVHIEVYK